MKNWKSIFWRVPLFCAVAGVLAFRVNVFLLSRFAIVILPDGSMSSSGPRTLAVYGAVFAAALAAGWFFFHKMTRGELFFSASVTVALNLAVMLAQRVFGLTSGAWAVFFMYLSETAEWRGFVYQLLHSLGLGIWPSVLAGALTPYLFVLFGQRAGKGGDKGA